MNGDLGRRTVDLNNIKKNEIVWVDLCNNLTESVFENEYKKAIRAIRNVLYKNQELINIPDDKRSVHSTINTAIPFIGERGTGKTSVMYSVLQYLGRYGKPTVSEGYHISEDNVRFLTFDMIDASRMKQSESILEIILSRMIMYLENSVKEYPYDHEMRELYLQMDRLHRDMYRIFSNQSFSSGESGLNALKQMADSQNTIEGFRNLVTNFLEYFKKIYQAKCYLVIALDDVDMYQGTRYRVEMNQFALLEQLYDYTRIPGMIVLVSFNDYILKKNCINHFRNTYFEQKTQNQCTDAEQKEIEILARQFMAKMFPVEQRVYMPNFFHVTSENEPNLYISIKYNQDSGNPAMKEIYDLFRPNADILVKEFILRLIAHKTNVYFDAIGAKMHFLEPRNLRDLGALYEFIELMDVVPANSDENLLLQKKNRQQLLEYFCDQFALERLNDEENRMLQELTQLPVHRQAQELLDHIRKCKVRNRREQEKTIEPDENIDARWRYSFGELLRALFDATRMGDLGKPYFSKSFVHCILGIHSVLLNELWLNSGSDAPTAQELQNYEEFMKAIGSSISGRWANKMLPEFIFEENPHVMKQARLGSVSLPLDSILKWTIPDDVFDDLKNLYCNNHVSENINRFIEAIIILAMLFTNLPKGNLKLVLEPELLNHNDDNPPSASSNKKIAIAIKSKSKESVCFNVLNSVLNEQKLSRTDKQESYKKDLQTELDKLWEMIYELFSMALCEEGKGTDQATSSEGGKNGATGSWNQAQEDIRREKKKRLADELRKTPTQDPKEIKESQKTWSQCVKTVIDDIFNKINKDKHIDPILPIQNFDMIYNIIKRLANISYYDIPEEAPIEDAYDYIVKLYRRVEGELLEQDKFYFNDKDKYVFSVKYKNSVFYQYFVNSAGQNDTGNEYNNKYLKILCIEMLKCMLPVVQQRVMVE